jgi:Putative metal-binding motif
MKKILLIVLVFASYLTVVSQSIDQYQYWYDNDFANTIVINNATSGDLVLNSALNTTSVSAGLHTINFRAKGNDGKWSTTLIEQFYNTGNWKIDSYEYWFDNDYSSKITTAVSSSQTYILTSNFDTSAVGFGTHTLNFRSRDTAGRWSTVLKEFFFKSVAGSQLSTAEYWIDADYANRQPVSFTSSNSVFINQSVLTSVLDNQLHTFNFRMQDQAGKWSTVTSSYFMTQSTIVGYEYWFDSNFAQKTTVAISPTNLLTSQPDFNASNLSNGSHVVHFRAKNNSGKYSITTSKTFIVDIPPSFAITATAGTNGSISPIGLTNVLTGTNQTYTITPNSCYEIAEVLVDGVSQGAIATYTFNNVVTTHTISATFNPITNIFYHDVDSDGFGNPFDTIAACTAPLGYVSDNTDCNDAMATANPNAPEILYNGTDDDCDGLLDEGFQLTTQLTSAACSSNLAVISATIYATPISGVSGYRFEVTNMATNAIQIKDKPLQFFRLTELVNYDYATTYSIRVMLKKGSVWLGYYGPSCSVTTPGYGSPTVSTIGIVSPTCGSTIPVNATIYSTPFAAATGYRFKVNTPGQPEYILDRTLHFFTFNSLPTYIYGANYTVAVAVKTTGAYSPYGTLCTFTTIAPTIAVSSCGATLPATGIIYATPLLGVTSYVFTVTNTTTNVTYAPIVRTNQFFPLSLIPAYAASNQYDVSVAVFTTGQQSVSGSTCIINPMAVARQVSVSNTSTFKAVGYPNPFASNFSLTIATVSNENISFQVYDMIGNRIESRLVNPSEMKGISFGNEYASGVYNVVLTQGVEVNSLRMIKR